MGIGDGEIVDAEVVEPENSSNSEEDVEASGPVEHPNNLTDEPAAATTSEIFTPNDGEDEDTAIESDEFDEEEFNV